ncbi:MAG: hypothetical protein ACM3S0_00175 [Acidobacteriota bacterium]
MKRIMVAALFAVVLVSILLMASPMTGSAAGNPNPTVLPPNAHPFGLTYAQWAAKWWKWQLERSPDTNPNLDPTGCSNVQSGPVWFLAGAFGQPAVERTCTVPVGKALLFPVMNALVLASPGDTAQMVRDQAKNAIDPLVDYGASVDGVTIKDLAAYRLYQGSLNDLPIFSVTIPEPGFFGLLGIYAPCSDDGVYLMLAPLPPGEHNIHYYANEFGVDVTYHLTVQ